MDNLAVLVRTWKLCGIEMNGARLSLERLQRHLMRASREKLDEDEN